MSLVSKLRVESVWVAQFVLPPLVILTHSDCYNRVNPLFEFKQIASRSRSRAIADIKELVLCPSKNVEKWYMIERQAITSTYPRITCYSGT